MPARRPCIAVLFGVVCIEFCVLSLRAEETRTGSESPSPEAVATETQAPKPDAAQGDVEDTPTFVLVYKFSPNQVVHYEVHQRTELTTRQGSKSESVKYQTFEEKHYRVVTVDAEGNGTLEPTIDRAKMTVQFDDYPEESFDSAESNDDGGGKFHAIKMSIGKPQARLRIAATGELLSVDLLQPTANVSQANLPNADAGQNQFAQNILVVLPEKPVRIGEQWNERYDVRVSVGKKLTRPVTLRRTFELKSVAGNRATIGFRTVVLTPVQDPAISAQLVQMQPAGTVVIDMVAGIIVSRAISMDEKVIGPWGPNSVVHSVTDRTERLIQHEEVADQSS